MSDAFEKWRAMTYDNIPAHIWTRKDVEAAYLAGMAEAGYNKALVDCVVVPGNQYDKMVAENKELQSLEKSYSRSLGEMARLCDTAIPWLLSAATGNLQEIPDDVQNAVTEIMSYVDAVRP